MPEKDGEFVRILHEVCHGCVSEDSLNYLRGRVISRTVLEISGAQHLWLISNIPVPHQRGM